VRRGLMKKSPDGSLISNGIYHRVNEKEHLKKMLFINL